MDIAALLIVIALVGLAVWFVGQPLRRGAAARARAADEGRIADLRAARLAKYGEIRDAEMDYRTGKLSEEDWRVLDRQLRAEAVDILHELDTLAPGGADGHGEEAATAADVAQAGSEPEAQQPVGARGPATIARP
ncbi:MAG TPA: hypothetical protein VMT10_01885 [Solirubrobacteraceae bacterium]|nr:hypothetical protein [Solirubrobacteraceae bacterium]